MRVSHEGPAPCVAVDTRTYQRKDGSQTLYSRLWTVHDRSVDKQAFPTQHQDNTYAS